MWTLKLLLIQLIALHYGYYFAAWTCRKRLWVCLMQELYTDTVSSVHVKGTLSNWFEIKVESDKLARLHHHSSCLLWIGSLNAQNIKAF